MTLRRRLENLVYRLGRFLMWVYLRFIQGLSAAGLENIPREGGCVIAGNHPSLLDPAIIVVTSPRLVRFMTAEILFRTPFIRLYVRGAGMIRVERAKGGVGAFIQAIKALGNGEVVGIFPQGHLVNRYEKVEAKDGAVQMAVRAGVPIIPCYCEGTQKILPRKRILPWVFRQCAVVYGEPWTIPLTKRDLKDDALVKATTAELMNRIHGLQGAAQNLVQPALYQPVAPFEHLLRVADEHPEIWEHMASVR